MAMCSATGAARRPERARSQDSAAPPAAVTATPAATPVTAWRRPSARPLTRSAPAVGRMCHRPNTPLVTAIAAGSDMTRRSIACSTPRKAISSHAAVPTGIRIRVW